MRVILNSARGILEVYDGENFRQRARFGRKVNP